MNRFILIGAVMAALTIGTSSVRAAGDLFLYNWTDYTAPDLVEKFESETGIKVTLDTYDSNETLLAKLKQGGGGYDIVVPSHNFVEILIKENLIQRINAKSLPGYDNIDAKWQGPAWDPGNEYTVPWQWGTTSFTVDSAVYAGNIDTYATLFEPPAELQGNIGMFRTPDEVVPMAQIYLGLPLCNESPDDMKKVLALLEGQKPHVKVYNSDGILERLISDDTAAHMNWNGYSMRAKGEAFIALCVSARGDSDLVRQHRGTGRSPELRKCAQVRRVHAGPGECGDSVQLRGIRERHRRQRNAHVGGTEVGPGGGGARRCQGGVHADLLGAGHQARGSGLDEADAVGALRCPIA